MRLAHRLPHIRRIRFRLLLVNCDPKYTLREGGRLADIIPTLIELMGMEKPAEMTGAVPAHSKNKKHRFPIFFSHFRHKDCV